jgi:hypothetical protein
MMWVRLWNMTISLVWQIPLNYSPILIWLNWFVTPVIWPQRRLSPLVARMIDVGTLKPHQKVSKFTKY